MESRVVGVSREAEGVPSLAHYIKFIATKMHLRLCVCAESTMQLGPVLNAHLLYPVLLQFRGFIPHLPIESYDQKRSLIQD